jgi:pyridoxamine 5'-phosphate oxidase
MDTPRNQIHQNVLAKLKQYMEDAKTFGEANANCCFLATCGQEKQPSVRIVTIYDITDDGLSFVAKKSSGKIIQIENNPKIGLCFFWGSINIQATLEGVVEPLNEETSSEMWRRRDHNANVSAWAVDMASSGDKEEIGQLKSQVRERFHESRIPLPSSWSGYIVKPTRIEIWPTQWKKSQKHQCYIKKGGYWHESSFH